MRCVGAGAVALVGAHGKLTVGRGRQHSPASPVSERDSAEHDLDRLSPRYQVMIGGIASVALSVSI